MKKYILGILAVVFFVAYADAQQIIIAKKKASHFIPLKEGSRKKKSDQVLAEK